MIPSPIEIKTDPDVGCIEMRPLNFEQGQSITRPMGLGGVRAFTESTDKRGDCYAMMFDRLDEQSCSKRLQRVAAEIGEELGKQGIATLISDKYDTPPQTALPPEPPKGGAISLGPPPDAGSI